MAGVVIILVAIIIAYLPSLSGGFMLDDDTLITANKLIKASDGLCRFWCSTEPADYWPMTNTTFWIEWRLWGMNSTGYRITNLIMHIIESLSIWLILRKLSIPGAFLGGLIFAIHPVNVESVAWISSRKNLMAMFFFLVSILCYLKSETNFQNVSPQNRRNLSMLDSWYWFSLATFVLAMLGKGSVAILPVLLLGIRWWQHALIRRDLLRIVPFFMVAVLLTIVNVWFQKHGKEQIIRDADFLERLLGAGGVVWFYLDKALLPLNLAFVYPQWRIQAGNMLWWLPPLAAVVATMVLWQFRQNWSRSLLFAWSFFCISLVPVMGFTDVGFMKYSLVSDHYQHIAIIGVIGLVVAGWSQWRQKIQGVKSLVANIVAVFVVSMLMLLTWQQSRLYRDPVVLYQRTIQNNPKCGVIYYNLGSKMVEAGRFPEAIEYYQQDLKLNPNDTHIYCNIGYCLSMLGRSPEAIEYMQQALRLKPTDADIYVNLGNIINKTGRLTEAIESYQQALRLEPDLPIAHYNLGNILRQKDLNQDAIEHYRQALNLKPDFFEAHNNLGKVLIKLRRYQEAIEHFKEALKLRPDYIEAYANLAVACANANQSSEAIASAQKGLDLARSKYQSAMAMEIEAWLNSYRASLPEQPDKPPSSNSTSSRHLP
jgi:tetratricopeptide (TPR) repeat protein